MAETTILTYGTFDLFHIGHVKLLRRARALGTRLIVGVSSDEFNLGKGKKCIMPFSQRKEIVESVRYVDLVIPETSWEQKVEDIRQNNVDIFVMGDDWRGKFDELNQYCKVVYLDRTPEISTTELKGQLGHFDRQKVKEIIAALQAASDVATALYGESSNGRIAGLPTT